MNPARAGKLTKLFDTISQGRQPVTPENAELFIEAICSQQDRAACLRKIISSKAGLNSLQSALRFHLIPAFFNGPCTDLLVYLQLPELKDIGGGSFLTEILLKIVEPAIFWDPFLQSFKERALEKGGQIGFAWLLHHLVSLPPPQSDEYRVQATIVLKSLLNASDNDLKAIGRHIQLVLEASSAGSLPVGGISPGGRHDNDFVDFRQIVILPTSEEIISTEKPFLRRSAAVDDTEKSSRVATHLDNQFRLLREDMLYEMREDVQVAFGKKKGHRKPLMISDLVLKGLHFGTSDRKSKWGFILECKNDIQGLKDAKNRKKFLESHDNRNFLRHQSVGCLVVDGEIITFATLNRDQGFLEKKPPSIVLQVEGELAVTKTLLKLKSSGDIRFVLVDTAIFAFEPVLKVLQRANTLPLSPELLLWDADSVLSEVDVQPPNLVELVRALRFNPQHDIQQMLGLTTSIRLDRSQAGSLIAGLTQKVSLIQGPPGTGKSFIGSLIAKAIHDLTSQTILVVCYTNHALDDILTSLLDVGIPATSLVRLGGKSTDRTAMLTMQNQTKTFRRDREGWAVVDRLKQTAAEYERDIHIAFNAYTASHVSPKSIMDHLEFEEPLFYKAFKVPKALDGFTRIASGGRAVDDLYLLDEWTAGRDGGIFKDDDIIRQAPGIWAMSSPARQELVKQWTTAIDEEQITAIYDNAKFYNKCQGDIGRHLAEKDTEVLRNKRIIGCTTTAAAKYSDNLHAASPDVLLVEEAGEILESHVLTALAEKTSQLILIGDHKQLRPKVNNYELTVEKGEGYDLNRSLFERLILKDYPHTKLTSQHRMRPEISALIRELTYEELSDAPRTRNRPDLRGAQDNIIFVDHNHPEDNSQLSDRKDGGATSSKQNSFEVEMVLKIVKYLVQQGYKTEEMVVLTPYLGQLQVLKKAINKDQDAFLNDLDAADLIAAGGVTSTGSGSHPSKQRIHLATIDNYQGEESDIVIISLTRSNAQNDIGFMFSPERLNVLLSRARNALIMVGNAKTFTNSRKGGELWKRLLALLRDGKHVYDGLPVRCDRHKDKTASLREPADFEKHCPDGGCTEPCCGQHECPLKCHQAVDHSKTPCQHPFRSQCSKGHPQLWKCHETPPIACAKCIKEAELAKRKKKQEYELQQKRDAEELAHRQKVEELNEAIARQEQISQDARLANERSAALEQKQKDLENAISRANVPLPASSKILASPPALLAPLQPTPPVASHINGTSHIELELDISAYILRVSAPRTSQPSSSSSSTPKPKPKQVLKPLKPSASQIEWQRQKDIEGASNDAIDEIMAMTGLEDVKKEVLTIKALIDTKKRQGTSFVEERLNTAMLGNPGTGKTTIARLYGKMLASLGALSGSAFFETTGSLLAHEGVGAIKKEIERITSAGGGTIFIDEAYQLTTPHNHGGPMVLDYLLAEMENKIGTLVFLVAGYSKEMEKFFEHNPGLQSRVPYKLHFTDYTDEEFLRMFENMIGRHFSGKPWTVEGGADGLYVRIAIRRLGSGRGRSGFGNARALRLMFDRILRRQALRLTQERKEGWYPDDYHLCMGDVIGPDPAKARANSAAWTELQSLVGLQAVKDSLATLMRLVDGNYQRELKERKISQIALNRVFIGSPGTGKTSVARLYGQILADLGLLSDGEVVLKNPSDFMGSHIGESEEKTKGILANTVGKVLIIDEAYMLYGGREGTGSGSTDIFKTAIIDTLVAEIQNVPGEDRCVLLLGYKEEMTEFFQRVNPGLSRRFAMEDAFNFEDFTTPQLLQILELKMKKDDLAATDSAKVTAMQVLDRARNRKGFGNGGADFDLEHDRGARAATNLVKLFSDVVGREDVVQKLEEYQRLAQAMKGRGMDERSQIPTNFVFKGPPGTGKTTIARKMGQVYYDMGFLSSPDVVECSASDLVGEYLGHTGPKTRKMFDKALGQVLFIDEAYRLNDDRFAKEAIDEIVTLLTLDRFKSKIIVILAGYEHEINGLLKVNPGLSSRFPDEIFFHNLHPSRCLEILQRELMKTKVDVPQLNDPTTAEYSRMSSIVTELSSLPTWGNARDMIQLSKVMIKTAILKAEEVGAPPNAPMVLAVADALKCMLTMLEEQTKRSSNLPASRKPRNDVPAQTSSAPAPRAPPTNTQAASSPQSGGPPPPITPSSAQATPSARSGNRRGRGRGVPPSPARASSSSTPLSPPPPSQTGRRQQQNRNSPAPPSPAQGHSSVPLPTATQNPGHRHRQNRNTPAPPSPLQGRSSAPLPTVGPTPGPPPSPTNRRQQLPRHNETRPHVPSLSAGQDQRDQGVSDAIWNHLEACKRAARERETREAEQEANLKRFIAKQAELERKQKAAAEALERAAARDEADRQEYQHQLEAARLAQKKAQEEKQRLTAALQAKRKREAEQKKKEEATQKKLREMGVCVQGYRWIKQPGSGYRCAGGAHFISDRQLQG
ncbi:hypothetical protein DXG01_005125 [Tephrocybe rancida]|nr:hypothetical protein DXG01_005125 [Tephrocybe rancida]